MKFNLKNAPELKQNSEGQIGYDNEAMEEWFEGFEKELRAKMAKKCLGRYEQVYVDIREILGE